MESNNPLVLAVDTTGPIAGYALARGYETLTQLTVETGIQHSISFFPGLSKLLEQAGIKISDVDIFAAATGPGSFTGLRVGLSAVKGLADTLGKPAIGINSIDATALASGIVGELIVTIKAGREEVYCGARKVSASGDIETIGKDVVGRPEIVLAGFSDLADCPRVFSGDLVIAPAVAKHAAKVFRERGAIGVHAYYVRPPDVGGKRER